MSKPLINELINPKDIQDRVEELAHEISAYYAPLLAEDEELLVIGILKGAFIFMADLTRALNIPRQTDFMALSSYDLGAESSGTVRVIMDIRQDIEGRHVLVVEDIIDSGRTMAYLLEMLGARKPASVRTCVLVSKQRERVVDEGITSRIDYLGFTIPDEWVVGYGLDWDERFRTLPYIGTVSVS